MSFKLKSILWAQTLLIVILATALLFLGGDLKQSRRMTLDQSNYCIRYTSDIIASSRLDLIREQDAHGRDVDRANTVIIDIIERYNVLVGRYNKINRTQDYDTLNPYSYKIMRTVP